jgi:hypothetical protein
LPTIWHFLLRTQRADCKVQNALLSGRKFKAAMRQRIRDVAASRNLSDKEIKPVRRLKHQEIARFSQRYGVSLEWLLAGVFRADEPPPPIAS